MSVITEKAMLVAVHLSMWTAVRHDKRVSSAVAHENNAGSTDVGRYNKKLLREAAALERLRELAGQIRAYVYKVTLPWSDDGLRVLPAHQYFEFSAKMREFKDLFFAGVDQLVIDYPGYIEQARPILGGLFRSEDYLSVDKLREKFDMKVEVLPIPSGDDFRVSLSEEERSRIASDIDANVKKSLARGTQELWARVYEAVSHMAARLSLPKPRLRGTMILKMQELVEIVPKLNITHDEELNAFVATVKQRLCTYRLRDLKTYQAVRSEAASAANDIAGQIKTVMLARKYEVVETIVVEEDEEADAPQTTASAPVQPQVNVAVMPTPPAAPAGANDTSKAVDSIFADMADYMALGASA
jgi:hypothetical protein